MSVEIIADLGSNWRAGPDEPLGKGLDRWLQAIAWVKEAGATAIKGQCMRPSIYPAGFMVKGFGQPLDEYVAPYEVPDEWWPIIRRECVKWDIEFMCSVFLPEDVALIDPLVQRHKIASFELGHTKLLETVRATGKPVLLSTGASAFGQVTAAARVMNATNSPTVRYPITMLHCVSSYPATPEQMNLLVIDDLQCLPGCGRGLSDHTRGSSSTAAVIAVALGASVIEKHVTEHHNLGSPDAHFSAEPEEFKQYVADIRDAEAMILGGTKKPQPGEWRHMKYSHATGKRGI